jgi:hypothetical protein
MSLSLKVLLATVLLAALSVVPASACYQCALGHRCITWDDCYDYEYCAYKAGPGGGSECDDSGDLCFYWGTNCMFASLLAPASAHPAELFLCELWRRLGEYSPLRSTAARS